MFIFYVYNKTTIKKHGLTRMFDYNEQYNKMYGSYGRNKWDGRCYRFLSVK